MSAIINNAAQPALAQESGVTENFATDVAAIQLRNFEALTKAQRAVADGGKAAFGQQLESFKSSAEQAIEAARDIISEPDVKASLRKRFAAVKASMQDGIGNTNILVEMSARSTAEAAEIIQNRTFEAFDEIQAMLETLLNAWPAAALAWRRS